jgi:hypothetical protein
MAASWESSRQVSCFSSAASFFARSRVPSNVSRIFTKARITKTLICTARALLRMFATCRAPCSVKAHGRYFRCGPRPFFEVADCDLRTATLGNEVAKYDLKLVASSAVSWNAKSSGKRSRFLRNACFRAPHGHKRLELTAGNRSLDEMALAVLEGR